MRLRRGQAPTLQHLALGRKMAEQDNWSSVLTSIIQQMAATDVTELEVRRGNLRIRLRRSATSEVSAPKRDATIKAAAPESEAHHQVAAPLTGVFYASPNPSSKPYLDLGDWVEPDTVVGLIETMKVFNEVAADCRGRVVKLLAQQGQLVHAGEPLLLVDLTAAPDPVVEVPQ